MFRPALLVLTLLACLATAAIGAAPAALAHPQDSAFDADHDGIDDPPLPENDNCAGEDAAYNPAQTDTDFDGRGDACDTDDDGDTVDDAVDNCPLIENAAQADSDGDATGDVCDVDDDGDGLADSRDNCRFEFNPDQTDADGDGLGNACDEAAPGTPTQPSGGPDGVAPVVSVLVPARHRRAELGAGLAVPVTCSERCTITSTLSARGKVLGRGSAELDGAGDTFVFLDVSRTVLRRLRRPLRAALRVEVADPAGNRSTLTRRLTIRR